MFKPRYKKEIKQKAEELRKAKKTYSEITKILGVPKSTLSVWLSEKFEGVFDKKAQLAHLARIQPLAVAIKNRNIKRRADILREKISQEVKRYPLKNIYLLKSMLAMLYSAEGARYKGVSGLKFANTDPKMAQLYITLLRKCYKLDESRFRIRLHLHYYHSIKKSKKIWSNLLNVPLGQFNKPYIKKRSKTKRFRKNFIGICFIDYLDSNIRREIMEIFSQLHFFIAKH
ncbi:MAG: hypothetical protein Q8O59_00835 [bacterium]|nr:hypothetical protein [bacterium]